MSKNLDLPSKKPSTTREAGVSFQEKDVPGFMQGKAEKLLSFQKNASPKPVEKWGDHIDRAKVERLIQDGQKIREIGKRMIFVASSLRGIPTQYNTLSKGEPEKLVVNFAGVDCVTFVELTLALAHANSYEKFVQKLREIRYDGGQISYQKRNHYMAADWTPHNARLVDDVTQTAGGRFSETVHKKLTLIDRNEDGVKDAQMATIMFISKQHVEAVKSAIREGDILLFTSPRSDLDVQHCGIATWKNGEVYVMNAKKGDTVTTDSWPLVKYIARIPRFSGIKILRPKEVGAG